MLCFFIVSFVQPACESSSCVVVYVVACVFRRLLTRVSRRRVRESTVPGGVRERAWARRNTDVTGVSAGQLSRLLRWPAALVVLGHLGLDVDDLA